MRGGDMRGEDGRRRGADDQRDEPSAETGREPLAAEAPVILHESSIKPLEQRRAQLLGRQPWHDLNGRTEWNNWANEVRQLWERLTDMGNVAAEAIARAAALYRAQFDQDFVAEANFSGFLFPGDVTFAGLKFAKGALFTGTTFHGRASFVARGEGEKVDGSEFNGVAKFEGAVFIDDADFTDVRFGPTASFEGAKFRARARFDDAQFNRGALFGGKVEFGISDQVAPASFIRTKFGQGGFGDKTDFTAARFHHDADFTRAEFVGGKTRLAAIQFDGTAFGREAKFIEAQFGTTAGDGS